MPLSIGQRVGPYEIVAQLGAGGMGEVYRARDSKLKRDVAIKVLHVGAGNDADRLARFQREAEVLASLNHPHIAHVYSFDGGSTPADAECHIVMELVDGEDLSQRIRRGPIALDEALAIARQIAAALEAAHEAGIVHRDLKPGNVKVREDGTVKVLDFGLAKALGQASAARGQGSAPGSETLLDPANTPTVVGPAMTMHGAILGTPAYMAPEQAKGKAVDKRADIWAFGCVLYEMLVGRATFTGDTSGEIMAAVVKSEPDWAALDAVAPPRVRRLLERCLDKEPRTRLRDIGDARILLDGEDHIPAALPAQPTPPARASFLPWAIAAAAVIAAIAIAIPAWRPAPVAAPMYFVEPVTSELSGPNPLLAPDGSFIVYRTDALQFRRLSEPGTIEIPGTRGAANAFVSPDSRWIGFYADGQMKKVAVDGREPVNITAVATDSPGAAFVSNDRILFSAGWYRSVLQSVSADGGPVTVASTLDEAAGERGHWWPHALPDGRHVLFTVWYASTGLSASKIAVLDLQSGTHRVLFPGARPQFANGHLLFYLSGQYHVAPFDPASFAAGTSKPVLPDAMGLDLTGDNNTTVTVAANGMVAYWPGELYPVMQFSWVDRKGQVTPTGVRSEAEGAALSPDDRQVVVGRPQAGLSKIWVFDLAGGEREMESDGASWGPRWHPDGRRIIYNTIQKGEYDVATRAIDGPEESALASDRDEGAVGWLQDGRMLILEWDETGGSSLQLHDPAGKPRMTMVSGDFDKGEAEISPDGRWLAMCSNPSGSYALYVRSMSEGGTLQRLSTSNAYCSARWSRSSKEIAFTRGNSLVSLSYEERDGRIVPLQETIVATLARGVELYGIARDGRFLVGMPPAEKVPVSGIRFITNGLAALQRN